MSQVRRNGGGAGSVDAEPARWLPWPVSALRERLRAMAVDIGNIRDLVRDSHAEITTRLGEVEAAARERWAATEGAARERWAATEGRLAATESRLAELHDRVAAGTSGQNMATARILEAVQAAVDQEPRQRAALAAIRERPSYRAAYHEPEPLVSIVIPTYDNHRMLLERAVPSVLEQTYRNLEVIVVGDAAPKETGEALARLGDSRVRYHRLNARGPYPDDPELCWLVAGAPPYNEGVRLARGRWIAPLDDDDAFHPDHVERLLECARANEAELAYGAIREYRGDTVRRLGGFPPAHGQWNLQACVYHAALAEIFELELSDAAFGIPCDWSLCRRMWRAGVRMAYLDEEVVHYHPSKHGPQLDGGSRPEWELVEDGWEAAGTQDPGWDVHAVADAYARKWPEFARSIDGTGPLGVYHEVPEGTTMQRDDPIAHNIVLSYGAVLERVARDKPRGTISLLDWGGALAHYYELGRRLRHDLTFDYHCFELPAVCEHGRRLVPEVKFLSDERELGTRYDLVMASCSLQYERDWTGLLRDLARRAGPWLYLTRIPVVFRHASFVARQRAYAYGYDTEYIGWVLNREELVAAAADSHLELVREFALVPPMDVAGAPENPPQWGFLFRAEGPS